MRTQLLQLSGRPPRTSMGPQTESNQSSRAQPRQMQDQVASRNPNAVAIWKAAHRIREAQVKITLERQDVSSTMITEEDRRLQEITNAFLHLNGDDSPRYMTLAPAPTIASHKHSRGAPCCSVILGCSPQGLQMLKYDPLLQNLRPATEEHPRTIKTEDNPSPSAPSTTNQVGIKSRVHQTRVFRVVSTRSQRLFSG